MYVGVFPNGKPSLPVPVPQRMSLRGWARECRHVEASLRLREARQFGMQPSPRHTITYVMFALEAKAT